MFVILSVLNLFFFTGNTIASNDSTGTFYDFIRDLYRKQIKPINQPLLELSFSNNNYSIQQSNFSNISSPGVEFKYGFIRFHDKYDYKSFFGMGSEYIIINNKHNNINVFSPKPRNINAWEFGLGMSNGYGWIVNKKRVFLEHSSSLLLSNTDYLELGERNDPIIEKINDELIFAQRYSSAFVFEIADPFFLDLSYEHTLLYPGLGGAKWFGSWAGEIILQRWIDLFKDEYTSEFGAVTPLLFISYKTVISLMFYELRAQNKNWPFISEKPVNVRSIKLNFVFAF